MAFRFMLGRLVRNRDLEQPQELFQRPAASTQSAREWARYSLKGSSGFRTGATLCVSCRSPIQTGDGSGCPRTK